MNGDLYQFAISLKNLDKNTTEWHLEEAAGEEAAARRALTEPANPRASPTGTKASTTRDTSAQAHTTIQDASFMTLSD